MKKTAALLLILLLAAGYGTTVFSDTATSGTYSIDLDGYFYRTQNAFLPSLTMTDLGLSAPSDIFCLDQTLYIADRGNRRVVLYDIALDQATLLEHEGFQAPTGIHVTAEGRIYVADPEAQKIFLFEKNLTFAREFIRPTDVSFGTSVAFRPKAVGVDRRGNLYVVVEGFGDGIIQLDGEGGFLGFFTSNKSSISFLEKIQDVIFTPEVKMKLFPRVPPVFSSLFVDESQGIVYSTSFNSPGSSIKKHNIAGKNMLGSVIDSDNPVDIVVDASGKIFVAYENGTIAVHSDEGRLLFFFGATSTGGDFAGLFTKLSSLTVDPLGNIWALDSEKRFLQRFSPTDYSQGIFSALDDYNRGDYDASLASWKAVLAKNQMSSLAHAGIAQVYLLRQDYASAAKEFSVAGERTSYSEAYWEVRNAYLQRTAATWLIGLIVLLIALAIGRRTLKKTRLATSMHTATSKVASIPIVSDLLFVGHVMTRPSDAFYELRLGHRGSLAGAGILLFASYLVYLFDTIGKGYIFLGRRTEDENIVLMTAAYFLLLILFIVGNTLVASIEDGNGKLSMVFRMTGYALAPAVLLFPISTILSNILTQNEAFLFDLVRIAALLWTFVTLSIGVAETHEYLYRNAIKSLLVTAFFILIAILSLSILAILGSRLIDFVLSVLKEVVSRV